MNELNQKECYTTVSDIALCQRCPVLLGYKIHMGVKTAWSTGIKGTGEAYGSIFHKHIARVFFEAAARPQHSLHLAIIRALSGGFASLEALVREKIFMPFIESESGRLTSGQIMSMSSGVDVWLHAMSDFFREIPSLGITPERVFVPPEQKLRARYIFQSDCTKSLVVTGCYDALLFNPDKVEARLFEFKGYNNSNIVVPLSQSLVYSWLIERMTGITPSVEIIYLDERSRDPHVFDANSVSEMIKTGLESLFASVFNIISLKNIQTLRTDRTLCMECRFARRCRDDVASGFRKYKGRKRGMSMLNVVIFLLFASMVMTLNFFYSKTSIESLKEEREIMRVRLILEDLIREAKGKTGLAPNKTGQITTANFWNNTGSKNFYPLTNGNGKFKADIHNLDYTFNYNGFNQSEYANQKKSEPYKCLFANVPEAYLIRAYGPVNNDRNLMIQVMVKDGAIKTWQEVWY